MSVGAIASLNIGDKIKFRSPTGNVSSVKFLEGTIDAIYQDAGTSDYVFSVGDRRHLVEAREILLELRHA